MHACPLRHTLGDPQGVHPLFRHAGQQEEMCHLRISLEQRDECREVTAASARGCPRWTSHRWQRGANRPWNVRYTLAGLRVHLSRPTQLRCPWSSQAWTCLSNRDLLMHCCPSCRLVWQGPWQNAMRLCGSSVTENNDSVSREIHKTLSDSYLVRAQP